MKRIRVAPTLSNGLTQADDDARREECKDILLRCGYDESEYFECWDCPISMYCAQIQSLRRSQNGNQNRLG